MESTGDQQETRKDPCRDLELEFFLIPSLFFPLPSPDLPLCRGQLCSKGMVPFLRSKTAFFLLNPRQKQHLTVGRQQPGSQLVLLRAWGMARAGKPQLQRALEYQWQRVPWSSAMLLP